MSLKTLLELFSPPACLACGSRPALSEQSLCLHCRFTLRLTQYHLLRENPCTDRFWGRLRLWHATAAFDFHQNTRLQELLHHFKYRGAWQLGLELGEWYGHLLKESPFYQGITALVPIPLTRAKLGERGYNQAACFARGLSRVLGVPLWEELLYRVQGAESLTKQSRLSRFATVEQSYALASETKVELTDQYVVLVDDVLTTGATLEACVGLLQRAYPRLRIATVTIALSRL